MKTRCKGKLFREKKIILTSVSCLILLLSFAYQSCRAQENKGESISNILYINSYHPGYSWSDDIEKGIREKLDTSGHRYKLSIEYLDTRRFTSPAWQENLTEIILAKYRLFPQDIILVSDNAAFDFAIQYRQRLFPDKPMLFCGVNNFQFRMLQGQSNISGINEETDIISLIQTALLVHPKAHTLVFILSTEDLSTTTLVRTIEGTVFQKYQDHYDIVLIKDAPIAQISEVLSGLPQDSVLFMTGINSDMPAGQATLPVESARMILQNCPIPAYTLWEFHLGLGVLGGNILTGYQQGAAVGDMAVQILNGKQASDIPILMSSPTKTIFDYNVMKRFGITMKELPKNSTIINKTESFYEKYKSLVWAVAFIIILLSAFVLVLSLNILKRLRAEKELKIHQDHLENLVEKRTADLTASNMALKESEARFHSLSDASLEGIIISEQGIILEANTTAATLFGYAKSEMIGMETMQLVAPESREEAQEKVLSEYDQPYETLSMKKDGTIFPTEIHGKVLIYKNTRTRVSAIRDITGKKRAEKEITVLRGILPICSHCKKIRNDDGYWNQLEAYIEEHSQAQFSHGLCQDCARKLFPDLDLSDSNKKEV